MSFDGKVLVIEADAERGNELTAVLNFIDCGPALVTDCNESPRVSWRLFGLSVRQQAGPSRRAAASSLPQLRPAGYI